MTATHVLAAHHAELSALVASLDGRDRSARLVRLIELVDSLTAHLAVESHFFYDRMRDACGRSLERHERRHATIKSALRQVVKAEAHDEEFAREVEFLRELLEQHIAEDGEELAPIAERTVPACELAALGVRMQDFYESAVAERARVR